MTKKIEQEKYERERKTFEKTLGLEHDAIMAKQEAKITQLNDHIKVLETTIVALKADIEAQRNLTKAVAESSRPQQPVYVSGGNNRN